MDYSLISRLIDRIEIKQAIKTALAGIISLYLCMQLDALIPRPAILISGLWCVVASIVVLQNYVGGTYKAIINRFLGVLIGSIVGASFAYFLGGNPFVIGLAVAATIILCSLLNLKEGYRIAALSVAVTIIPWAMHPELSPWSFALFRFLDTCLGILVAVVVTHTIWPSPASTKVRTNTVQILDLLDQLFHSIFILDQESPYKKSKMEEDLSSEIERLLLQTRLVLEESSLERIVNPFPSTTWKGIILALEEIFKNCISIENVYKDDLEGVFDEALRQEVNHAKEAIDKAFKYLSGRFGEWDASSKVEDLNSIDGLNEQLARFRSTGAIRKYDFEFVERYFVFFFSLKSILQEQNHLNELLNLIHNESA